MKQILQNLKIGATEVAEVPVLWRQDKVQRACTDAFAGAVRPGPSSLTPFEQSFELSRVCIEAARSLG